MYRAQRYPFIPILDGALESGHPNIVMDHLLPSGARREFTFTKKHPDRGSFPLRTSNMDHNFQPGCTQRSIDYPGFFSCLFSFCACCSCTLSARLGLISCFYRIYACHMRAISAMDITALTRTDTTGGSSQCFQLHQFPESAFCNVYTCDTGSLLHEAMFMNQRLSAHV